MRTRRYSLGMRVLAWTGMLAVGGLELCQAPCQAMSLHIHRPRPYHVSELKPGFTQTPNAAQLKQINAKLEADRNKKADVRLLTPMEMKRLRGRGNNPNPYRSIYFAGTAPWQRSFRNVNLCNGDLFLSYTDIQVAPARGAGLALQRTYNSQDPTIGPFGIGWTHAYDIRMSEETSTANMVDRKDFFGMQHRYHRDADGLYTPPPYLYDELSSLYLKSLVNAPTNVDSDTDIGMDGTIKHFSSFGSTTERVCDYIQDRFGNRTTLSYYQQLMPDGTIKNQLQTVTDPSGRALNFVWSNVNPDPNDTAHPAYRITSVSGQQAGLAYTVRYDYYTDQNDLDSLYNLKSVTLDAQEGGLNRTTSYTYASVSNQDGTLTENALLTSITDPLGHTVSYQYAVQFVNPLDNNTYPSFTGTAWVSQIAEPAGVDSNNTPRTAHWNLTQSWDTTTNTPLSFVQCQDDTRLALFIVLDGFLRFSDYQVWGTPLNDGSYPLWWKQYDTDNNVTFSRENGQVGAGDHAPARYTSDHYSYGPHGNVLTHTADGFSGEDVYDYGDASQYFQKVDEIDRNGHKSVFIIGDDQGNDPLPSNDPNYPQAIVPQNPGNKGNVLHVQDAGYNDPNSPSYHKQTTYFYNAYGQKIKEINPNGVETDYTYGDSWGNLTQVVQDPGSGHLNKTTTMDYDINGRVMDSIDANGNASQNPSAYKSLFVYNDLGQPLTASFPATASTPAETISYNYGGNGRTESVSDNRGTTLLNYEAGCDRVSSVSDPATGQVSYTYGITGPRLSMSLPGGQPGWGSFTYNYGDNTNWGLMIPKDDPNALSLSLFYQQDDQNNRIDYLGFGFSGLDLTGGLEYVRTNETYQGGNLVSYQQSQYNMAYGVLGSVQTIYQPQSGSAVTLLENDYTYDNVGQRLTNKVTYWDTNTQAEASRTETYTYDDVNRLSTVDYGQDPDTQTDQTQNYSFDAMGNRVSKTDSLSGTESYLYNAANMLLSRGSNSYSNDANGNTLNGGGRTNVWDSQNRLVSCVNGSNTCSYTYGTDGLRHQTVINGVTTDFVLDVSMFVRELQNGSSTATYLMGFRGPEYRRDDANGGTVRWYVYDGLGSVVEEVDPYGNITASRKYDVYGSVRSSTGLSTSKHKFVGSLGHPSEDETGLIYMRARYLDPITGRFISQDPAHKGMNWFVYAHSNPISHVDPSGKDDMAEEEEEMSMEEILEMDIELDEEVVEAQNYDELIQGLKDAGYTEHGAERFVETFENIFGKDAKLSDGIDLLSRWNPAKAFFNNHARWQMEILWQGILINLVCENLDGTEVVTVF